MNQNINGLTSAEVEERIKRGESNLPIKPLTRSYKRIFTENICTIFNLIKPVLFVLSNILNWLEFMFFG